MVNADDLKSSGPRPCRFDSCPGHQCIALEPTIDPRESDLPHLFAMAKRQKVLILYLTDSSLDSKVVAWAQYDGSGEQTHMSGDSSEPPYESGLAALRDGWRLFQFAPLRPEPAGAEYTTSYLKYEFAFEQFLECS